MLPRRWGKLGWRRVQMVGTGRQKAPPLAHRPATDRPGYRRGHGVAGVTGGAPIIASPLTSCDDRAPHGGVGVPVGGVGIATAGGEIATAGGALVG